MPEWLTNEMTRKKKKKRSLSLLCCCRDWINARQVPGGYAAAHSTAAVPQDSSTNSWKRGKGTGQFSLRLTQDAFNGVALYELQIWEFDVCSRWLHKRVTLVTLLNHHLVRQTVSWEKTGREMSLQKVLFITNPYIFDCNLQKIKKSILQTKIEPNKIFFFFF